jgi:hypothetical protein
LPKEVSYVLLSILKNGSIKEKIEATACVVNMAANEPLGEKKYTEFTKPLQNNLMFCCDSVLVIETLNAIRNIAGDSISNRDHLLLNGLMVSVDTKLSLELKKGEKRDVKIVNAAINCHSPLPKKACSCLRYGS